MLLADKLTKATHLSVNGELLRIQQFTYNNAIAACSIACVFAYSMDNSHKRTFSYDLLRDVDKKQQLSVLTLQPVMSDEDVLAQAEMILEKRWESEVFQHPTDVKNYLSAKLHALEHEVFAVCFLTTQHQLIVYEEMFRGTIDAASVYPREVVKAALNHNAAAVILAHNHPSGVATPSLNDDALTNRIVSALQLIDIRVLDHIIVGKGDCYSYAEEGKL